MCADIIRIQSMQDTLKVVEQKGAKIIIAGSGMASGGRVLTYFQKYLGQANATILLVGYQAEGTRGRSLLEGANEIKLYGKYYTVKASIKNIEGLSAHADQQELINWLSWIKNSPENIFIVHGEKDASSALQDKINEVYGWKAEIPVLNQTVQFQVKAEHAKINS